MKTLETADSRGGAIESDTGTGEESDASLRWVSSEPARNSLWSESVRGGESLGAAASAEER
jgi:hypothetical protein